MEPLSKIEAPTVKPYEMLHYKTLSESWWNPTSAINTALCSQNELRIPWVVDILLENKIISESAARSLSPLEGLTILDAGCGGGYATEALAKLGCTIVGLDPCPELIEAAKSHLLEDSSLTNITYINGTMEEHCEKYPETYDIVFASEVVDHVKEQELFLEVCVQCLKPGGSLFITTFNKTWLAWFLYIVIYEYVTGSIPIGTHALENFISPEDVKKILKKYNCKTKSVLGFYFNYFTGKWTWTGFTKSLSYALHAMKKRNVLN